VWESVGLIAVKGGPWGLLTLVVLSLIQGWLIPLRTHLARVEDLKAAISALEATVREREQQIGILLSVRKPHE
jgi:hypothetical protein